MVLSQQKEGCMNAKPGWTVNSPSRLQVGFSNTQKKPFNMNFYKSETDEAKTTFQKKWRDSSSFLCSCVTQTRQGRLKCDWFLSACCACADRYFKIIKQQENTTAVSRNIVSTHGREGRENAVAARSVRAHMVMINQINKNIYCGKKKNSNPCGSSFCFCVSSQSTGEILLHFKLYIMYQFDHPKTIRRLFHTSYLSGHKTKDLLMNTL